MYVVRIRHSPHDPVIGTDTAAYLDQEIGAGKWSFATEDAAAAEAAAPDVVERIILCGLTETLVLKWADIRDDVKRVSSERRLSPTETDTLNVLGGRP